MHSLTSDGRRYQLRVDLVNASGHHLYQTYDNFAIGALPQFTLYVGNSSGTAGK